MDTIDTRLATLKESAINVNDFVVNWCNEFISSKAALDEGRISKFQFLENLNKTRDEGPQIGAMTQNEVHQQEILALYVLLENLAK
jgi:hypothetical protein